MKTLIWQYWLSNPVLPGAEAGSAAMSAYAQRIGADYRFDRHMPWAVKALGQGVPARWYDKLRCCFDPQIHDRYDNVAVIDLDVFPVDGLHESIFEAAQGEVSMCEEPDQPYFRSLATSGICTANDLRWSAFVRKYGAVIPRNSEGQPRTWNAGVIVFTREGMRKVREAKPSPYSYYHATRQRFVEMYCGEQNYLCALAAAGAFSFHSLDVEWNRMVHHYGADKKQLYDKRTPATKFVHVMFRAADWNDAAWHHRVVHSHLVRPHGTRADQGILAR